MLFFLFIYIQHYDNSNRQHITLQLINKYTVTKIDRNIEDVFKIIRHSLFNCSIVRFFYICLKREQQNILNKFI